MKFNVLLAFLLSSLFCISCAESVTQDEPEGPAENETGEVQENPRVLIELSSAERETVAIENAFALDFFKKIVAAEERPNICVSPLSLSTALSLVAGGAQGDTRSEMLTMLGFNDLETANRVNAHLAAELQKLDKTTEVSIANSLWLDNSLTPNETYIAGCRENFNAEIFKTSLWTIDGMRAINQWAKDKTKGFIPELLTSPYPEEVRFSVVNALYFKGAWTQPFDKDFTLNDRFVNIDGTASTVPMMRNSIKGNGVYDTDGAHWISLSYGNGAYEMLLVLPDEGMNINSYLEILNAKSMSELLRARKAFSGNVLLPRFKFSCEYKFEEILKDMGIEKAFMQDADFSMICPGANLGSVIQKTAIEVDESGSEAAAATAVGGYGSTGDILTGSFFFNRPFAFMIMEQSSGAILFMGRVGQL